MPDRAAEPDPRDASAYEAEGKSLQKLNRHREAIACADKALRLNPGSASAHRIKGKSRQRLGEHRKAIACFDREIYRRIKVRDHSSGKPGIGHLI